MFQGFYNLTSGIICQNRNMNVVSNNIANVSTPGFKKDTFATSTFREEMLYRNGNKDKSHPTPVGERAMVKIAKDTVTDFKLG
ncbi:MAG: flagellar basal body protein, partial [Lachnospiraceae bacterium]